MQFTASRFLAAQSDRRAYLLTLLSSLVCAVLLPATVFAELSVYLDCKKRSCDGEFIRRELAMVDFVRDPKDAQVHALITRQRASISDILFSALRFAIF